MQVRRKQVNLVGVGWVGGFGGDAHRYFKWNIDILSGYMILLPLKFSKLDFLPY